MIKNSNKLPDKVSHSLKITRTKEGKYKLSEPVEMIVVENQDKEKNMLFIDPGSKVFLTGYDPSGKIITIGKDDMKIIGRLLHFRKKLQSKKDKSKQRNSKYKIRKAIKRLNERIKNLVEDLHKKVSKFLTMNYSYIYIPKLNFHTMKNLKKTYKLKLSSLSLCSFVDFLSHQGNKHNSYVKIVTEEYTSKTCSRCGIIGSCDNKRIYNCKRCKMVLDRDINGARNIMIKFFTKELGDCFSTTTTLRPGSSSI